MSEGGHDARTPRRDFSTGPRAATCYRPLGGEGLVFSQLTEEYFAAEDEVFRTGGDLPINTCDPSFKAAHDAIQERWGHP